jgi:hypothetical protein
MDGISAVKVHPDLMDDWIDAMPDYLKRDILRLGTDHEILYRAAASLIADGGKVNIAAVVAAKARFDSTALGDQLAMRLVIGGHPKTIRTLLAKLSDTITPNRLAAAVILAGGKEKHGLEYLMNSAAAVSEEGITATAALGRYGDLTAKNGITRVVKRHPLQDVRRSALGELAFRRHFPTLYRLFETRYRFVRQGYTERGLYETWMTACLLSTQSGARTVDALKTHISRIIREPPFQRNGEAVRRQLKLFLEFIENASGRLAGPSQPQWPKTFDEAMTRIQRIRSRTIAPDTLMAERISAIIAIAAQTGDAIGYPMLAEPTPSVRALSAFGERTLDGNLATSWQIKKHGAMILEHQTSRFLSSIQIMLKCPTASPPPSPASMTIEIIGEREGKAWHVRHQLSRTHGFFQNMPIKKMSDGRVTLILTSGNTTVPACVSEIRLRFVNKPQS